MPRCRGVEGRSRSVRPCRCCRANQHVPRARQILRSLHPWRGWRYRSLALSAFEFAGFFLRITLSEMGRPAAAVVGVALTPSSRQVHFRRRISSATSSWPAGEEGLRLTDHVDLCRRRREWARGCRRGGISSELLAAGSWSRPKRFSRQSRAAHRLQRDSRQCPTRLDTADGATLGRSGGRSVWPAPGFTALASRPHFSGESLPSSVVRSSIRGRAWRPHLALGLRWIAW